MCMPLKRYAAERRRSLGDSNAQMMNEVKVRVSATETEGYPVLLHAPDD